VAWDFSVFCPRFADWAKSVSMGEILSRCWSEFFSVGEILLAGIFDFIGVRNLCPLADLGGAQGVS
jgi:hypothetical protein